MNDGLGKLAEQKIREWLNRPDDGYSFDRIPDNMSGFYQVSRNICDFVCYKYPNCYYIESKATEKDRFDFSVIPEHQLNGLAEKSKIFGCYGWFIILFATYKRAVKVNAVDIKNCNQKSLNILKIQKWDIPYKELQTVPNNRKKLLDYTGNLEDLI